MKILVVNYEYPPIGGGGGSSCKEIVTRLAQRGHNVDVFTAGYKDFPKKEKAAHNVNIFRIKSNRKSEHEVGAAGLINFIFRGMFKIKKFASKSKYDIIHYHFSVPTGLLSFFHSKKTPIVYTLHGIDVPGFHADEFPLFQKVTKPFNKRIIKKADAVVAVSNNLKNKALETFKNKQIKVIYHGVDIEKFKPLNVKKSKDSIDFICIARLVKFKRIDILLKAFSMLIKETDKNVNLTIAGTGYMAGELKLLAKDLNIEQRVNFMGYVSHETLPRLINKHHVFILPSVHDSFGIVFLEAMACGIPCIGADAAGVPEVIDNGKTGLLAKPEDEKSLFESMLKLVNNKALREKMGKAAAERVINKFSWESIVSQYEALFKSLTR